MKSYEPLYLGKELRTKIDTPWNKFNYEVYNQLRNQFSIQPLTQLYDQLNNQLTNQLCNELANHLRK